MSNSNRRTVSIGAAAELVSDCIEAGLVGLIIGPPGAGKTGMIKAVASSFNLKLIGHNLTTSDPTDLTGFPCNDKVVNGIERSTFTPPDMFPLECDPLPLDENGDEMEGWLLNLDELPSAEPEVQTAAHKLIHERMIGQHKLHPNCAIVATGNDVDDGNHVNDMTTAMQSRLSTMYVYVDEKEFMSYAIKQQFDHRMIGYLSWKPEMIHCFDPNHDDATFSCPRTIEATSDLLQLWPNEVPATKLPLLMGTIGSKAASGLFGYCAIYADLPSVDDIARAPIAINVPDKPDQRFALAGLIGQAANTKNAEGIMDLIGRMPLEFQVLAMSSIAQSTPSLKSNKFLIQWFVKNANELY